MSCPSHLPYYGPGVVIQDQPAEGPRMARPAPRRGRCPLAGPPDSIMIIMPAGAIAGVGVQASASWS